MAAGGHKPRTAEGAWYNNYAQYKNNDDQGANQRSYDYGYEDGRQAQDSHPARITMTERRYQNDQDVDQRKGSDRLRLDIDRYNDDRYNDPGNGKGQYEWEPPQQFSPRKSNYEPGIHPGGGGEPRQPPPWERDIDRYNPRLDGDLRGAQLNDGGQGAGFYDRQLTPRLTKIAPGRSLNDDKRQTGGAFLFVRFPLSRGENTSVAARACIQAKTSDLGGRFVGIARKVFDFGYPTGQEEGCAVFQFPSLKNAEVFFHSDKRIRQPDFPPPQGHAEIFALTTKVDPNSLQDFDTFLMSEISLNDGMSEKSVTEYLDKFVEPFTSLLTREFQAVPYVVFSQGQDDRKSLRRHFFHQNILVTIHVFRNPKHLEDVMGDKRYSYLRAIHNSLAVERCSIFTIDRQAFP